MSFELTDRDGKALGSFTSRKEAEAAVPSVTDWLPVDDEFRWHGWGPDAAFRDKPHYVIRMA